MELKIVETYYVASFSDRPKKSTIFFAKIESSR